MISSVFWKQYCSHSVENRWNEPRTEEVKMVMKLSQLPMESCGSQGRSGGSADKETGMAPREPRRVRRRVDGGQCLEWLLGFWLHNRIDGAVVCAGALGEAYLGLGKEIRNEFRVGCVLGGIRMELLELRGPLDWSTHLGLVVQRYELKLKDLWGFLQGS